jgi:ATP-binding cassette, subfamily C, bacterial LapB
MTDHGSPEVQSKESLAPLLECVSFLARFLGLPASHAQIVGVGEAVSNANGGGRLANALAVALAQVGLVGTPLQANATRRPAELPALLVASNGRVAVAFEMLDGRTECYLPGIQGSTKLTADQLALELPQASWTAVRPALHFDQRSLLYTLPQAGRWFWDTFNRNRWIFGWALLGTLALNVFGALVPFYSMAVYDRVIPNNAMGSLGVLTAAVVLLIGFELVMRVLRSHLLETAAKRMDVALSARVFSQCLRMRAAERPASGGVLANTVRDFESIREFFTTGALTVLGDLPFMLLYLGVIALVGGWLVAVPLLAIPVLLSVAWYARNALAGLVNASMQASTQRTAHLFETMNGIDTVKALGAEAWSRRKWEGLTQAIAQNNQETREVTSHVNYVNTAVLALVGVAVVAVGAVLMDHQAMTLGQIIAVSMLAGRALAPVSQLAGLVVRWQQTRYSYAALERIMASPTDDDASSLQAPPLTGAIEFRDVGFAYPKSPPVFERLNLIIRPGERVAVIGKLGSGKSTLFKLILNQYAPDAGGVLMDDLVCTQLEAQSLRRQIGYVPQDVSLFHGTLRENIELGRTQPDDAALLAAMRTACLDDIVQQLPAGVAAQVGERGERLSGGQRQLAAVARALFSSPKLLLLDEPSSMVDPATEQKLIERLRALTGTTIVVVTHRMAMLALVDRLVVMDKGRVVADGPRDEVLSALAKRGAGVGDQASPAPAQGMVARPST